MSSGAGGVAGDILRSFIERIERLEIEKTAIAEDIKDVYAEAKGSGFEPKIMRTVLKLRKLDAHDRQELEALTDIYLHAVEGSATVLPTYAMHEGSPYTREEYHASGWTDQMLLDQGYMRVVS